MNCGNTSCLDQQGLALDAAGSGSSVGFMQVIPEEFTREELKALLKKTRDLLSFAMLRDAKREFLEELELDLDLLDALAAREEQDLAELNETIEAHSHPTGGLSFIHTPRCATCPHDLND